MPGRSSRGSARSSHASADRCDPGRSASGLATTITPEDAGWRWAGLRVLQLEPGIPQTVETRGAEVFLLPLSGGALTVRVAAADGTPEAEFGLTGRDSVFSRLTDFAYAGRDSLVTLTATGRAEVAVPSARCSTRRPAAYGPAEDVPVQVRGAGTATWRCPVT